jgi:hypothetical protein
VQQHDRSALRATQFLVVQAQPGVGEAGHAIVLDESTMEALTPAR